MTQVIQPTMSHYTINILETWFGECLFGSHDHQTK